MTDVLDIIRRIHSGEDFELFGFAAFLGAHLENLLRLQPRFQPGDGVNLASRLEELTKTPEYEARVIVSGATLAKAKEKYRTRRLGEVAVKGKQIPTEIFALLG